MADDLLGGLAAIVGPGGVVTDGDRSRFLNDWRDKVHGDAVAVVLPRSTEEVAAVVRLAASQSVPVVPQGGNTSMCFGSVPHAGDRSIVLSLSRMNAIRELDREGSAVVAEAGTVLATLHEAAESVGRQFPLHLGAEGTAQVGGLISSNAGGTGALRYGPMRDLVFGLEVVLPNGTVLSDLSALRKDNRGYNLNHLFIGAEGTLGVVTAAALKLHPALHADADAFVSVASPAMALELLARMQDRFDTAVQAFELLSGSQIRIVEDMLPAVRSPLATLPDWAVVIHLGDPDHQAGLRERLEDFLSGELSSGRVLDGVVARSTAQAREFWKLRHSVTEANLKAGFGTTLDASVRVSAVPAFLEAASAALVEAFPDAIPVVVSHLGDGNVHFIAMFLYDRDGPERDPAKTADDVQVLINDIALAHGGSFSAEHGIGRKLVGELKRLSDPNRYDLMLQIKHLLDPAGIMNPGVLFPPGS
ncbi:FAD-binding oxidoreductase [Microbaculum marinum]|uniref:FAD-binding oxidoreductase n=1 Tax=Microbaculum marinum TaxID=1764581 RepID=A0AAW9RPV2_9HYPH